MVEKLGSVRGRSYKIGYHGLPSAGVAAFRPILSILFSFLAEQECVSDLSCMTSQYPSQHGRRERRQAGATFLTVHAYPQTMHARGLSPSKSSNLPSSGSRADLPTSDADLAVRQATAFTVPELVPSAPRMPRHRGRDGSCCSAEQPPTFADQRAGMVL